MRLCNRYQRRTCASSSSASSRPPRRCIIASKKRAREVVRETGKEIDPLLRLFLPARFRDAAIPYYVRKYAAYRRARARDLSLINSVNARKTGRNDSPLA